MAAVGYYSISFNANGGAGAPGTITGTTEQITGTNTYTATVTLPSAKPSRTYYTFLGWGSSSGSTSASHAAGGTMNVNGGSVINITLWAVWKRNTAYVYYNANGGTNAPATQSHNAGTNVTLSATKPTRTGYIFKGWATSATATVKQYDAGQANVPLYTTTTLYAVWQTAASTISANNGELGSTITLNISRTDNSYTDTITYQFGTASGTIVTGTSAASVSWIPPTTLASEIPNASTATCTFTCKTYNGATLVGQTTKTITLTVPQSLAPTVSVSYADTNATASSWGVFVQSRSTVAFTITASGQESATVVSYSTTVNGTSYTTDSFTTDELINSGTNTYTVVVTDSRGLQTTVTGTYSVEPYGNPSLTLISCDRDDSDDSQINVEFNFTVSSVSNFNDANYALDYKLKSAPTWTQGTVKSLGGYSGTISDQIPNLDGGDEWNIRIRVIDSFATATALSEIGVSGNILLNSRHLGGMGLLMKSQANNQMDVGKPTVFHGKNLQQFGSTVQTHSTSGTYAKVLTFGTNVQAGKNMCSLPQNTSLPMTANTVLVYDAGEDKTFSKLTLSYHLTNAIYTSTSGAMMDFQMDDGTHKYRTASAFSNGSVTLNSNVNTAITDMYYHKESNITFRKLYLYLGSGYCAWTQGSVSAQLELGDQVTPYEPYIDTSNLNINAPITIEYAKTGDVSPTTLTVVFNRDYSLESFTKDASADAFLHNSATAIWDLYIGKNNSSDSVEILDMHNPWSNTDITVEWDDTSISSLPTGYVSASPINTVLSISPDGVSVSNNAWKTVASITLPRGIWILSGYTQFNSNSTGIRSTVLSTSQDSGTSTRNMSSDLRTNTGNNTSKLHFVDIYQIATQTTYYLNAYQNSGSAITTYGRMTAIKII